MAHSTRSAPPTVPVRTIAVVVLALEALLLLGHFLVTPADVETPRYVVYPFIWINVALYAVYRVRVPDAPRKHRWVAAAVAGGYFLLLANWAGLFGLTSAGHHAVPESTLGFAFGSGSPGRSRVQFVTETFYVSFVPFRVIGFFGLAYLVYVALLDVAGAAVSGTLGVLSCISCSLPIVASAATGVWGGSVTLMSTVYDFAPDVSTAAFLVSVGLLYWRPGFSAGRLRGLRDGSDADDE